ncbi:hypothetical protein BU15DRAFT_71434 [Melanogaster broomeanus]|nr:hypothetical protein BU15DRAFT_71434 [Melanogaster broomeanus]
MKLAPIGCVGEIFVSGPSVGLGYLGDPDATAQLFVEDPFRKEFRMYRTGDLGRVNHEGRLYFIGRRDNQVWLNGGFRIGAWLLSTQLKASGRLWSRSSLIKKKRRIAAFFAPRFVNGPHILKLRLTDDAKAERLRLFEFIEPRLMKFCYPELWISVDALPCTVTGKLDRKGLKAFFHGLAPSLQDEVANFTTDLKMHILDLVAMMSISNHVNFERWRGSGIIIDTLIRGQGLLIIEHGIPPAFRNVDTEPNHQRRRRAHRKQEWESLPVVVGLTSTYIDVGVRSSDVPWQRFALTEFKVHVFLRAVVVVVGIGISPDIAQQTALSVDYHIVFGAVPFPLSGEFKTLLSSLLRSETVT